MASNFPGRPRNTLGFTLGAVGGPRGTGAGISRTLIQFVTQYDKGQLEQLTKDLQTLKAQQATANNDLASATTRQKALEDELTKAKQSRLNLDTQSVKALKSVLDIQARSRAEEQNLGRVTQQTTATLLQREKSFRTVSGLSAQQAAAVISQFSTEQQLTAAVNETNAAREKAIGIEAQVNQTMEAGVAIASARQMAASQIEGLLMGAVGGVVGGAVVTTLLYAPLQAFMDKMSAFATDIIDPAHKARDAIADLGKTIDGMVDDKTLTRLAAAQKYISEIQSPTAQGAFNPGVLAAAAQAAAYQDLIDKLTKYKDLLGGGVASTEEAQEKQLAILLYQIDLATGKVHTITSAQEGYTQAVKDSFNLGFGPGGSGGHGAGGFQPGDPITDFTYYLGQAKGSLDDLDPSKVTGVSNAAADAAQHLKDAADAASQLRDQLNQTAVGDAFDASIQGIRDNSQAAIDGVRTSTEAAINEIRAHADATVQGIRDGADATVKSLQRQSQNLQLQPSQRTQNLEASLKALSNAGPSKQTQALADAIARLNAETAKQAYLSQLAGIAEQKHQILLAQSLANAKSAIDINKYQGQDRLIAIDAEIKRMQNRNQAQDTFNKLLDLQYQISQGVQRQQGETIQDFISRRTQYYRGLIQQASDLRRQGPEADLQAEKDRISTTLQLRGLEAQKKALIEDHARQKYLQSLQDQLKASQEHDQKELQSRRDTLQAELDASKKADQQRLDAERQALQDRIDAVRKNEQQQIDAVNNTRDSQISAAEAARDATIAGIQKATDTVIAQVQKQADAAKAWASYAATQQTILAIQGAQNTDEVYRFGGEAAGAGFSGALLATELQALGIDPGTIAAVVANAQAVHDAAMNKISSFAPYYKDSKPPGLPGGYQDGGAFVLRNSQQNPFGSNIRHGEDGRDEIGIILSNKVVQAFRGKGGGQQALFGGDMVIQSQGNPYQDRAAWRREVKAIVREELKN